jgi:hypothetical protein
VKYLDKSFTVAVGKTEEYRNGWDAIFGKRKRKKSTPKAKKPVDATFAKHLAEAQAKARGL